MGAPRVDPRVLAIARELTRVRQRGLELLDLETRQQTRRETPALELLATDLGYEATDRVAALTAMLRDQIAAFASSGRRADAEVIRGLFFDPDDGPATDAGSRLEAARTAAGMNEERFRGRQLSLFRDFAAFMVANAEARTAEPPSDDGPSAPRPHRRRVALASVIGTVIVIVVLLAAFWIARRDTGDASDTDGSGSGTTAAGTSSSPSSSSQAVLRFDDLGSTYSTIVLVYPGVTTAAADKQSNGSFHSGDTVAAVCKLAGRTITSDPNYGETPRSENTWIRIVGTAGLQQYATLTYAQMDADSLAALPTCS